MTIKESPMNYNLDDKASEVETKFEEFLNSFSEFEDMFYNYFNSQPDKMYYKNSDWQNCLTFIYNQIGCISETIENIDEVMSDF